ncbi:asparagine synthase (glutamine-hydrolyzing) [Aurantibacillus circumpalustris]|uniref:asparagine synthase (glutamine-hydrolyzing) n=1 Tax=Aurantibacillus circumpalustris TaxID=3036359 RepID=UPI00295B2DC2|nr:asparagine synthase (glutamine-hydrolyzing) [Aurantibacillus circumpalustris]
MCGINGFISEKFSESESLQIVQKMNKTLAHRGPDNDGVWQSDKICFGHRRLSIIDLSEEGNQPFFSSDKRYVIVYNGELYNYKELKLDLQRTTQGSKETPYFFKTNSDTEVILAAFIRWGKKCLDYFNGMYAFAIYDTAEKKLIVARDRVGVKPLYYYYGDEGFMFSSEIRPIIHSGIKKFSLNKEVIGEYMMYQSVFAPNTIIRGVKMLMPGHFLELENEKANITKYYSVNKISNTSADLSYKEICKNVHDLLGQSVQRRLVADVPFGAFLSGGIDSGAIVGLMSKVSSEKIQTFNVSFDESEFSESKYAQIIAKKFNTQHHEIKLSPADFLKQLPEALLAMDHPSGDGPNTYIVSKATKNAGITMALSGIGGDELFAGYDVFKRMAELQKKSWLNAVPQFARKAAGFAIQKQRKTVGGNKIQELLAEEKINFKSAYPLNRSLFTKKELEKLVKNSNPLNTIQSIVSEVLQIEDHLLSSVSISEINTYLQNTLLRDTDQMSMAVALEVREPFLDYKLIEFVLGVNDECKYPHSPKKLLIDSLGDLLPNEIVNRPKMGFTLPWQHWMKNDLKNFCEEGIKELSTHDFFNKTEMQNLWTRFLGDDKKTNWSRVWHLVVLNNWLKENKINS